MNGGLSQFARVLEAAHYPERRQAMRRFDDIDPMNIDPDTNQPYANYSSPSLDTSFHDGEMDVDEETEAQEIEREFTKIVQRVEAGELWTNVRNQFKELELRLQALGEGQ